MENKKIYETFCQVIVCGDLISWRGNARKMIVFTTGQVWIVKRYWILLVCLHSCFRVSILLVMGSWEVWWPRMMDNVTWTPEGSMTWVWYKTTLAWHSVNIIWVVTSSHLFLYQGLTQLMTASVAGEISSDSSTIVELIEDLYGNVPSIHLHISLSTDTFSMSWADLFILIKTLTSYRQSHAGLVQPASHSHRPHNYTDLVHLSCHHIHKTARRVVWCCFRFHIHRNHALNKWGKKG